MDDVWKIAKQSGQIVLPVNQSSISVLIKITSLCRSHCRYCLSWQTPQELLPLDVITSVIKDIEKFAAKRIVLSGGEPTSHPDFHKILEACSTIKGTVGVITDGQYPPASPWVSMIDELTFSIDTISPNIYKKIRGIDGFLKAIENLEVAVEKNVSVAVNIVLSRQAIQGIGEAVSFFKEKGVAKIYFLPLETHVVQEKELVPSFEEMKQFEESILPNLQRKYSGIIPSIDTKFQSDFVNELNNFSCLIPWLQMTIRPNGEIYPCCRIGDDLPGGNETLYCLGNVREESLYDIWCSQKRINIQSSIASFPPFPCRNCEIGELFKNKARVWNEIESIRM